jgi:outer membrane autotransporter protein
MKAAKRPRILSTSAAALLTLLVSTPVAVHANNLTWTGSASNFWENPANWNSSPTAGLTPGTDPFDSDVVFTGSRNTNTYNDNVGGTDITSILFASGASAFRLNGNQIFMDGGGFIVNNSSATQVIQFVNTPGVGGIQLNQFNFNSGQDIPVIHWVANGGNLVVNNDVSFSTPMTLILGGLHNIYLTGSFFNTAVGDGNIVVDGPGSVYMTGHSTYTGNTTINGGTLYVNGSIASAQTFVNPLGTLAGTGIIFGNVINAGNVAPGDAPGVLTVKGNYGQSSTGTLTVEIDGHKAGQYSALAVGGQAALGGELRIVSVGNSPRLKVGQKVTILTAAGGVAGKFSSVDAAPLEKVLYKPHSVAVEMASFGSIGNLTPNQTAVAKALDTLSIHNQQGNLISYLQNQSLSNLPGDYDRIAPAGLTSIFQLGVSLADVQSASLQRRTEDIRYGSHGFSASGFAAAGAGPVYSGGFGVAGPNGDEGKDVKETKEIAPTEDRWGVFITGSGEWVNVNGDGNARGYDLTSGGFTFGGDYKVTPNFAIGIDAGYVGTAADLTDHGRVLVNGGKLGLYSTYFTGGFYVDTAANGGYNSYDERRSALQGTARGDTDGGEFDLLIGTGYDFKAGGFTFGPTATFQYTYVGMTHFGETGSLAPLQFPGQYQDSLRTAFGVKASYDWKVGGIVIKPELRAAWQHEYGDNTFAIDSSIDGASSLFRALGPQIGRDSLLLGAGFAILWNERTSTYLYYDGELARTRYEQNAVSGGVRVSF